MNRLIVFIVSLGLACLAISSTCLAAPAAWGAVAPQSAQDGTAGIEALSPGLPAIGASSNLIGGGLLSF